MRIAVGAFRHTANSFAPTRATLDEFERGTVWPGLQRGESLLGAVAGCNLALAGFAAAAQGRGHDLVPLVFAAAAAGGPVERDAFERIAGMLLDELAAAPVDAVHLDLSGSLSADHEPDGDGEIAARVRAVIGPDVPLLVAVDGRANISERLFAAASVILPSVGHARRAAGEALAGRLGGPFPARALRRGEMLIRHGRTFVEWGVEADVDEGGAALAWAGPGNPFQDVPHAGAVALAYGDDAAARAGALIGQDLALPLPSLDLAEASARLAAGGPLLLLDIEDDPALGATGDAMRLLPALLAAGIAPAAFGAIADPHVATLARRAGERASLDVCLGGKHGGMPFEGLFHVKHLENIPVTCHGPLYGGARIDLAPAACLDIGGVQVLVVGKRLAAADPALFRHAGIEPAALAALVLKGGPGCAAAFADIAAETIAVRAGGLTPVDLASLPYRHLAPGTRLGPEGPLFRPPARPRIVEP